MSPILAPGSATAAAVAASGTTSACQCHQRLLSFRPQPSRHSVGSCSGTAYLQHQQLSSKCHALQKQHRLGASHPQQQWQQRVRRPIATAAASGAASGAAQPGDAADGSWFTKVVLPMALVLMVCNMDRICLSVAILPMAQEYGWPATVQVSSADICCVCSIGTPSCQRMPCSIVKARHEHTAFGTCCQQHIHALEPVQVPASAEIVAAMFCLTYCAGSDSVCLPVGLHSHTAAGWVSGRQVWGQGCHCSR
jgi:hypothetical protein